MPEKWCPLIVVAWFLILPGCTSPTASPMGEVVTTIPTNEPTPLPTASVPAAQPYTPQNVPATPVCTTAPAPYITPLITPYSTPVYPVYTPVYQPDRPPVYPGYIPVSSPYMTPAYISGQPGPVPAYRVPGSTPYPTSGPASLIPADIVFRQYSDQYFGIDYPSSWTVTRTSYVQFSSPDGRIAFTAEVSTFLPGFSGDFRLNPDISFVQDGVSHEFPQYDARNIIYNYQTSTIKSVPVTIYSVGLPDGSVSYTRYVMVTLRHVYQFTFSSDTATFDQAAQLRNYMFSTLSLADTA